MNMDQKEQKDPNPAVIIPGLGSYHHEVSTKSKDAQRFFDQGLTLIYAFNHNEAIHSFQKAASLDPELAMAYWGIAFALGPNYNLPADNDQRKQAYSSMKKAVKLSKYASQSEKDYISALSKRYVKDVTKTEQAVPDLEFKQAMKALHEKYPDDPDAATLYAESLMDLKPWQLWNKDGTPAEGTEEIVSVLESVLKNNPNHPGANHYYIHAVEASDDPGRALASCKVLETLIPAAGHLVHMPAHIYFRVGDYEGASVANEIAIKSDESYISKHNPQGIYPVMYYNHNINFLSVSRMMEGKYDDAIKYANMIAVNVKPALSEMQMLEALYANPLMIYLSFGKWDEIINFPETGKSYKIYSALYHYSKGIAFTEKGNLTDAKKELALFNEFKNSIPPEALIGLNTASLIMNLSDEILKGKITGAEGDRSKAIELFQYAVQTEDQVNYDEPPDWYPSVRLSLGSELFLNGNYAEAEKVFRDELKKYPHNGRGLFGLMESLKAQGKNDEAKTVSDEFNAAWKNSDVFLNIDDF
jgi:tetratricopeptide (TPR) repeat protein